MSKDDWKDLPTDILRIVFYYLEKQPVIDTSPIRYIGFKSPNLLQCQLTCKKWSFLAESKFRKKGLVNYVRFLFSGDRAPQDIVISVFRKIALHFSELKAVYHYFAFDDEIWKVVESERFRGRFAKLHVIPFRWSPEYEEIVLYNDMAWDLRQNLRELRVHDVNPAPVENTDRISHFSSVDTVQFKLRDFSNVYSIDQQLKKSSSVRSVGVDSIVAFSNYALYSPVQNSSNVHALPYIRQLDIKGSFYDSDIFSYIMRAFPNLRKIKLTPNNRTMSPLPTDITIQFLRYLLRIRNIYVAGIPLQNIDQVLMEFYDQKRMVDTLDIVYLRNKEVDFSNVSIDTHNSRSIYIVVKCRENIPKITFPRIGMIEKNADNVRCIRLHMEFDIDEPDHVELLVRQEDNYCLSNIFSKCPNLNAIYVLSTILRTFGTSLQERKIPFIETVEFSGALVYGSFLFDMSFHFPFIGDFRIDYCRLDGETEDNITINMSDTKFTNFTYCAMTEMDKLYLKLTTIENNNTRWFVASVAGSAICTENEYQNSLQDRESLSIFIQCKQVDTFTFRSEVFELVGKNILKLV
ncbi:hypothetical protein MFLAVUS_008977 [Mucor flavus]|uniref:F-box domain-containing protein n=1 Tax=Mucor flavus TaxID=439312 RepID=A0ABP9Z8L6_9FUNG